MRGFAYRFRRHQVAASTVVGSLLMVAVTTASIGGLAALVFTLEPPAPKDTADFRISVHPGTDGTWGDGNEHVLYEHLGGDPLMPGISTVTVFVDRTPFRFVDAALDGAFADGFVVGERWTTPNLTIDATSEVSANVVSDLGGPHIVAERRIEVGSLSGRCATDVVAPTVSLWTQTPADLDSTSVGSVTVAITARDTCHGVDNALAPRLYWRIDDGSPGPFQDLGPMTNVSLNRWVGTIPAQNWAVRESDTLQYYVAGLTDHGGNVGNTPVQSDLIDPTCLLDFSPPTVGTLSQVPSDVTTSTTGDVDITVILQDNCWGVDQNAHPTLWYRVNPGTSPAYTDGGSMLRIAANTWVGTIPDQGWNLKAGQFLEYYLGGMRDEGGNSGSSTVRQDLISLELGSMTWDTAADWDAATASERVIHTSYGDKSDGYVRLGYNPTGPQLESFWHLDEDLGLWAADATGNAHDGRIVTVSIGAPGVLGSSGFRWNDGGWVQTVQSLSLPQQIAEMTVCTWFFTSATGSQFSNQAFLSFDKDQYFAFYIRGDTGQLAFDSRAITGNTQSLSGGPAANDGNWHHGCAVYVSGDKILYLDGVEVARDNNAHNGRGIGKGTATRFGFLGDGSTATTFPGSQSGDLYNGGMDEVRFFLRGLSPAEVDGEFRTGINGVLLTDWRTFASDADAGALEITDAVASLNNQQIQVIVESDIDGDGIPDETSGPVTLVQGNLGPYLVPGLTTDNDRFRLRIVLDTFDVTKTPILDKIALRGVGP